MNFEQLKEVIVAALPNCNPDAVTPEAQLVPDVCADSLATLATEGVAGYQFWKGTNAQLVAATEYVTVNDLLTYLKENK